MFTSQDTMTRSERGDAARSGSGSLIDPLFIAGRVWRARFWILLLTLLGAGLGALFAVSVPRPYFASTDLILDPRGINLVQNEVTQTPLGLASDAALALIQSQIAVVTSSSVLGQVIDEVGLTQDPEFNGTAVGRFDRYLPSFTLLETGDAESAIENRPLVTLQNLRRAVTAVRNANSFVITVTVKSENPEKAARLANLIADTFVAEQVRAQAETVRNATAALSSRLVELRGRVSDAEEAVERYRLDNQLLGVQGRLIDDDFILRINQQLADVRAEITGLNVRAESMRAASVDDVVRGAFPEELSSPTLVRLRGAFADAQQQNAALAARLGPRHPQRIASEEAVSAARQAIAGEFQRIVASAQTELARARETERDLTSQIETLRAQQFETSESFVGLRELQREVDASRAIYEAYLLRSREISSQESLNTLNVRTISEATPPLQPGGLSRKLVVAAGGILGFGVGLALALLFAVAAFFRSRPDRSGPVPAVSAGGSSSGFDRPVWTALPPPAPTQPRARADNRGETEAELERDPLRRRAAAETDPREREARGEDAASFGGPSASDAADRAGDVIVPPAPRRAGSDEPTPEESGLDPAEPRVDATALPIEDRQEAEADEVVDAALDGNATVRRERLRQRIRDIGTRRQAGQPPLDDAQVSAAIRRLSHNDRPSIAQLRKARKVDGEST